MGTDWNRTQQIYHESANMIYSISIILLTLSLIIIVASVIWLLYIKREHHIWINKIFFKNKTVLLDKRKDEKKVKFNLKLMRAGINKKQFKEIRYVSIIAGLSLLSLIFILELSTLANVILFIIAISIAIFTPYLYLEEQMKARVKRIENDLTIFIDLLIIILEGGGGLNNAIDKISVEGRMVLGKDLLDEFKHFKNEFITYSSEVAYNNLIKRTGSEAIATIVGFMRLSEETGIGVKSIFENQAQAIKAAEMKNIEKRAAMMNINITFVMFIFILPAIIAMVAFPMAADALISGF